MRWRCACKPARCSGAPSKATVPLSGHSSPTSIRSTVDLPAPLGPIKAVVMPLANCRETVSRAMAWP